MPTLSQREILLATALVQQHLEQFQPGETIRYTELAAELRLRLHRATDGKRYRLHHHLLRAACERLRESGEIELWGRSLRDGRWVLVWIRLAGRGEAPAPTARIKWQPKLKRKGRHHVAPEFLARVEAILLELLRGPHDPREVLLAAYPRSLPGPGWVPYYYLTCRVGHHIDLHPSTRHNTIGLAVRNLASRGLVSLLGEQFRNGKRRVRWVRLASAAPAAVESIEVVPSGLCPLFIPGISAEASKL